MKVSKARQICRDFDPVEGSERKILCTPGEGWDAGDRTGKLGAVESADLWKLREKIFAKS